MNTEFAVIFDMDGVLVDSNPAHEKAIHHFCKLHNREATDEFLRERVFGRTNKEWLPEVFGDISEEKLNQLADEKEKLFRDSFDPKENMIAGLMEFLEELKTNHIKCAVATSAPSENAEYILSSLKINNFFHSVLDSSDVEKGKPEPDIYLKAAKKLNQPIEQCIVFEDSLAGVEAGVRSGAKVVGITSTHSESELYKCSATFNNFMEIEMEDLHALFTD